MARLRRPVDGGIEGPGARSTVARRDQWATTVVVGDVVAIRVIQIALDDPKDHRPKIDVALPTFAVLELCSLIGSVTELDGVLIGVSTTAIVLVLAALQGRRTLKYGSAVAGWYKAALVTVGAIGLGLALGVLEGFNPGRLVELGAALIDLIAGAV